MPDPRPGFAAPFAAPPRRTASSGSTPPPAVLGWGVSGDDFEDGKIRPSGNASRALIAATEPEAMEDPFGIVASYDVDTDTGIVTLALNKPPAPYVLPNTMAWIRYPQSAIVADDTPPDLASAPPGTRYGLQIVLDILTPPADPACLWRMYVGIGDASEGPSSADFAFIGGGWNSTPPPSAAGGVQALVNDGTGIGEQTSVSAGGADRITITIRPIRDRLGYVVSYGQMAVGGDIVSSGVVKLDEFDTVFPDDWAFFVLVGLGSTVVDGPHSCEFRVTVSPFAVADLSNGP